MRTDFHDQLTALTGQLAEGCELVGVAMADATDALLQANLDKAEDVIAGHRHIAQIGTCATKEAFSLLALQAPVAGDLRQIVGAIQIAADVQRMGAPAGHAAKIVRRHPQHLLPQQINGYFAEMGGVSGGPGPAGSARPRPAYSRPHRPGRQRDRRPAPPSVLDPDGPQPAAQRGNARRPSRPPFVAEWS